MRIQLLFLLSILVIGLSVPVHGNSLQEYVDSIVNAVEKKHNEKLNLNDTIVGRIWTFFKQRYGRVYSSAAEEKERIQVFRDNVKFVLQSNKEQSRTFELELNGFADWKTTEFDTYKKGLVQPSSKERRFYTDSDMEDNEETYRRALGEHDWENQKRKRFFRIIFHEIFKPDKTDYSKVVLKESFDWRERNVVSSVKDQLLCNNCYAFATTAIIETLYALKNNLTNVIDFSPQQMSDCSKGNKGCNGGNLPSSVFYVQKNKGKLATLASYPILGKQEPCRKSDIKEIHLGKIDYRSLPTGDEVTLAKALVLKGPIFIGLDADSKLFMFYKRGILNIDNCPNKIEEMDHGLVIVGYGLDKELQLPYWIIKNSYGPKWGENGYLRLAKDAGNMCGVSTMAAFIELK